MKTIRLLPLLCGLLCGAYVVSSLPDIAEARRRRKRKSRRIRKKAKRLFKKAQMYYRLGRFVRARKLYEKAYELLPLPGFLYNIAQCHRMEKRYERAVYFYKSYLSAKSAARNRDMVQVLISRCEAKMRKINKRKTDALNRVRAEAERVRAEKLARLQLKAKLAAARKGPPPGYLPPKRPAPKPLVKQWWFWTSIAGGVVALVVTGLAVGLTTSRGPGEWTPTSLGLLDRR